MKNNKIKAGIIGGAGYTGGELIRLLIHHPEVEIAFVQSKSNAGKAVSSVHSDLEGETELRFSSVLGDDADVLFLCSAHGDSKKFLQENAISDSVRIIDLSTDFRNEPQAKTISGERTFLYGLPELNSDKIKQAKNIANPGCFATAIELALLPLAASGLLKNEIHIHAITGSTGAGQSLSETSHFSWRNNNLSAYKVFNHQHLIEISNALSSFGEKVNQLNFIPVRGDFSRGIFASVYTDCALSDSELKALYSDFYQAHPFTVVSATNPHLKQVVNTNKCIVYPEIINGKAVIISVIDNLLKGASGQAVHNMNLMFGLDEKAGLGLKGTAF